MSHSFQLGRNPRLRPTAFTRRVEQAGVTAYTVYNHMLLPTVFRSVEEDYAHLKSAVQIWDVAGERQVEINGPDAERLVQMTTPRDLSRMADDQCYYIPTVDQHGGLLNDPVLNKLATNRYWVSLADSDLLFYYQGLAVAAGLDVRVFEPDVSPLAIQGPKANTLISRVFGEAHTQTRFFRHKLIEFNGQSMILARSGWSLQGGFELYVDGHEHAEAIWDTLFDAGEDLDVRAGCPNGIERIEGGLLSYGCDMTREHSPYEAGLGKYCNLDNNDDYPWSKALKRHRDPEQQIRALEIDGDAVPTITEYWPLKNASGEIAGRVSSIAWSPDFKTNVAIGMVHRDYWSTDSELTVVAPDKTRQVRVRDSFWI